MTKILKPLNAGCLLESGNDWHNAYLAVDLAEQYGFTLPRDDWENINRYRRNQADGDETIWELVNGDEGYTAQATEFLKGRAPLGYHVFWANNALFMMPCRQTPGHGVICRGR